MKLRDRIERKFRYVYFGWKISKHRKNYRRDELKNAYDWAGRQKENYLLEAYRKRYSRI